MNKLLTFSRFFFFFFSPFNNYPYLFLIHLGTRTGYFCKEGTTAENEYPCSKGKYSVVAGISADAECIVCAAGRIASMTGTNISCTICNIGKFILDDAFDATKHIACKACAEPTNENDGYGFTSYTSICEKCPKGKFRKEITLDTVTYPKCWKCPGGKYLDEEGRTKLSHCKDCNIIGEYSNDGSDACTICPGGWYSEIKITPQCIGCKAGKFNNDRGDNANRHNAESDCGEIFYFFLFLLLYIVFTFFLVEFF